MRRNYFESSEKFINDLKDRLKLKQGFYDDLKQSEMNPEILDMHKNVIDETKKDLLEALEDYKLRTQFKTDLLIKLITFVFSKKEVGKVDVIKNDMIVITIDGEEILRFPNQDIIDLRNFVNIIPERCEYLKDIVIDLVNQKNVYTFVILPDKELVDYIIGNFDINYMNDKAIHDELIDVANKVLHDILFDENVTASYNYDISLEEIQSFLESLKKGEYNSLVNSEYWFMKRLEPKILTRWHSYRKKVPGDKPPITQENFVVFFVLDRIIQHIKSLIKDKEYYIAISGITQTEPTKGDIKILRQIAYEALKTNFDWREAREVLRNYNNFGLFKNPNFPHNMNDVDDIFKPKIITYFNQTRNLDLTYDLNELRSRAKHLCDSLDIHMLKELFTNEGDFIDEYIRRMILSQWDFSEMIENYYGSTSINAKMIRENLLRTSVMDDEVLRLVFSDSSNNDNLLDLAKGTLMSLSFNMGNNSLFDVCKYFQKALNCNEGTVYYNDFNSHSLPNGDMLISTYYEDIEPQFASFDMQYRYYYKYAKDLEYVEGCTELFGNVLKSQIFRNGNKRTSKCLFNAMLMNRGIIPPIADLNENDNKLWLEFAYGRFDRYPEARYKLLLQTIDVNRKFKDLEFREPTDVLNRR